MTGIPPATDHRPPALAGRVEVRLLRRLPAHPARLRGRAAGARRRGRHRPLHRDVPGDGRRAPTTCRWWRARSPRRRTPSASGDPGPVADGSSPSGPAPPPAASRGCATSPPRAPTPRPSTRTPSTSTRSTRPHPSPPTSRSTSSCTAARSTAHSCSRSSPPPWPAARPVVPGHPVCHECKAAGHRVPAGRRGDAPASARSPGPGAARSAPRSAGAASAASAGRHDEHRVARRAALVADGAAAGGRVAALRHLQRRRPRLLGEAAAQADQAGHGSASARPTGRRRR